jgi:protein-S-isoprenylcysteine O-methyltransferase Ste14
MTPHSQVRPGSVSYFYLNLLGVVLAAMAIKVSSGLRPGDGLFAMILGGAVLVLVIAVGEAILLRGRVRTESGLTKDALRGSTLKATTERCIGLLITLAACGVAYWVLPEYQDSFYQPYWRYLRFLGPFVALLAPWYFHVVGQRQVEDEDAYLQLGRFVLTLGGARLNRRTLKLHITGWMIKAFFLPVMVSYFSEQTAAAISSWNHLAFDKASLFNFGFNLTYMVDLLISVVGYTLTLRVLDTQIRSTDPTVLGWLVTVICYRPIYQLLMGPAYLNFQDGSSWETKVSGYPVLGNVWLLAIMATFLVHLAVMISFGLRFSNLTHRGIITNGPFRFTKHPGYIAKNVSWWLIYVPFIPHSSWQDALRHSGLLVLTNLVYFMRAKTEERHLMRDPVYVAYSRWIDQHGLFRARWSGRKMAAASNKIGIGTA